MKPTNLTALKRLELETKYLTDPTATKEDKQRYFEVDRGCRKLDLLKPPVKGTK